MPDSPTTAPAITIIGNDREPSDIAIAALSRLLLAVADADDDPTTNKETAASVT